VGLEKFQAFFQFSASFVILQPSLTVFEHLQESPIILANSVTNCFGHLWVSLCVSFARFLPNCKIMGNKGEIVRSPGNCFN
jgi:hypothetical protein